MNWPNPNDYHEAIQNPHICFQDPDLKAGTVACTALGLPRVMAGNFAAVYEINSGGRRWAVRCFLRQVKDQHRRYELLSRHLDKYPLDTLVDFKYLDQGIRVKGEWFPIVKMEWVDGESLSTFIQKHLGNTSVLERMAKHWRARVVNSMQGNHLAHGDLQHGNVLVKPQGQMYLVDYDGMYVPRLKGEPAPELGHPNFQHPKRTPDDYDEELDNFAALVIYTSLKALMVEPKLWQQFHTGENLILSKRDYEDPKQSLVLKLLKKSADATVKNLAAQLEECCQYDVVEVPEFDQMIEAAEDSAGIVGPRPVAGRTSTTTTTKVQKQTGGSRPSWLGGGQSSTSGSARSQIGQQQSGTATTQTTTTQTKKQTKQAKQSQTTQTVVGPTPAPRPRSKTPLLIGLALVLLMLIGGGVWYFRSGPASFDPALVKVVQTLSPGAEVHAAAFTPDGQTLAGGMSDGTVALWNATTGERKQTLRRHTDAVTSLAFSADGALLASASADFNVVLWDVATGQVKQTLKHGGRVNGVVFSPDGKFVASACDDGVVRLWDAQSGQMAKAPLAQNSPVKSVAISADGQTIASGGDDGVVALWDAATGNKKQTLRRHSGAVPALAFSPNGKLLATGGADMNVNLWDVATGQFKQTLRHRASVNAVAFTADNQYLATGTNDTGTVLVWNVNDGKGSGVPAQHAGAVYAVAVSSQEALASGGADAKLILRSDK